jgi:hypothetical protein
VPTEGLRIRAVVGGSRGLGGAGTKTWRGATLGWSPTSDGHRPEVPFNPPVKAHAEALAVWSQFDLIDQLARRTITHSAYKHELDVQVLISNGRRHAVEDLKRPIESAIHYGRCVGVGRLR